MLACARLQRRPWGVIHEAVVIRTPHGQYALLSCCRGWGALFDAPYRTSGPWQWLRPLVEVGPLTRWCQTCCKRQATFPPRGEGDCRDVARVPLEAPVAIVAPEPI